MIPLKKTVFITGGAKGIGAACARAFSEKGYNVAVYYRNSEKKAEELAKELESGGTEVLLMRGDCSDENSVREMVTAAETRFGRVDVLVNNAGISYTGLLQDMDIQTMLSTRAFLTMSTLYGSTMTTARGLDQQKLTLLSYTLSTTRETRQRESSLEIKGGTKNENH